MLDLIKNNLEQIAIICKRQGVKRLELFGSAARGDFDPAKSDLDFFVEFDDYGDPAIADRWFGLQVSERSIAEQITEYDRIIGFRNQVIHGYQKIDDEITWRIIEQKVPVLKRELEELLA